MISLSRRRFLQGASAMPLAAWLSSNAFAQSTTLVRYDIASPQGLDMLTTYANAMRTMLARPETDPTSWLWQWYTHFVSGATTKAAEQARIFGTTVTPQSMLANEMWNTCQSHAGQNTNHFLPWHRMFVFFFEQIIREVSGRPDFTLPYWDYTSADPLKRGIVPLQFRLPLDPVFNVLYRSNRTQLANTGQRIDKTQPTDQMDITATMETKQRMLACHQSQFAAMSELAHTDLRDMVETQSRFRGIQAGCRHAEGFTRFLGRPREGWLTSAPSTSLSPWPRTVAMRVVGATTTSPTPSPISTTTI